jgi:DNA-directed RNA polymerase specialized sigma24 family protein
MDDFNTLVNSNIYKGITANVCKNHVLKEDLHFESILVIVEKKVDFSEIRDLKHFFAKIVWLTWHSNKFRKKYLNEYIDIAELDDIAENNQVIKYDKIQEKVNDEYNNEHEYYEKNLLRLYVELGNCRAISKQTNIPYRTVANDIQHIKDKLKKLHNEENSN